MMSFVVFGALILFAVYAMVHFLHDWWESKRDEPKASDRPTPPDA